MRLYRRMRMQASWAQDPRHCAWRGDSAGGNLAAAVALMARDRGDPRIAFQLLVSPVSCAVGCSWRCVLQAFDVVQCIPCNKFRDPRTLA